MKTVILLCAAALAVLCGCDSFSRHDVVIANESGVDVAFTIDGYGGGVYELEKGKSLTLNLYSRPRFTFTESDAAAETNHAAGLCALRVRYDSGTANAVIADMLTYTCTLTNWSEEDVTVTEKNDLAGTAADAPHPGPVTVPAGGTVVVPVYTPEPEFMCGDESAEVCGVLWEISKLDSNC